MSNFRCLTVAIAISAFCCWSANVMAQFGGPQQMGPPAISPYVNMLRSDASPALNYYGLVRPQQQFAQQNQQLGQGLQSLQMQMQGSSMPMNSANFGYSQLGATGHPVIFNSFGTSRFSGGYTGFGGGGLVAVATSGVAVAGSVAVEEVVLAAVDSIRAVAARGGGGFAGYNPLVAAVSGEWNDRWRFRRAASAVWGCLRPSVWWDR